MFPSIKLDMTELRLSPAFAFEAKATAEGIVEGLGAVFGGDPDSYGDVIEPGAFSATLSQHRAEGTSPAMLWSHDPSRPVGRWETLAETTEGLAVRGRLNLKTDAGRQAYEHLLAGDLSGLSIGYQVPDGGADTGRHARRLTRVNLLEVSLVAIPANRRSRIRQVKHLSSRAELRDLLRENGLPRAAADRLASGGWPALAGNTPDETEIRRIAAEVKALAATLAGKE